jgi:septal ring factor EnvC (AmiA/AmiB activator)
MKEKNEPTKIVKGGFRTTLALILSIIAISFSVIAFNRTTSQTEYQSEIKELKQKLEKVKQETSERVSKIRKETANAIKKMGIEIKKQEDKPKSSEN